MSDLQPETPEPIPCKASVRTWTKLRRYQKIRRRRYLPRSKKPIAKIRPKRRKELRAFHQAVVPKFGGYCIRCFVERGELRRATDPHHWQPRGKRGGDNPENGLPMCRDCHTWAHIHERDAIKAGWLLLRGEKNDRARWIEKVLKIGPPAHGEVDKTLI